MVINLDQTAGMKEMAIYALNTSENILVCSTAVAMWHKDKWHKSVVEANIFHLD